MKKLQIGTLLVLLVLGGVFVGTTSCTRVSADNSGVDERVPELVFYGWPEDQIVVVFDAFTEETGIPVRSVGYESQEEAIDNMRAGQNYDIVNLDSQFIPGVVAEGLIVPLHRGNIPNFKNVPASFRDLAYDPGSKYTIPYSWGTTGIVIRTDLVDRPVTKWADLWDAAYAGRVVSWTSTPRYTLGMALLTLGYSVNSEDPDELEAALAKLLELKPSAIWLSEEDSSAPLLVSGEAAIALGWSYDLWLAQEEIEAVEYVLPEEGTILWNDVFVVPSSSAHQAAAEQFLNFILRPEIAAQLVETNYYPMANDKAAEFLDPEILADPVVYPSQQQLDKAEMLLPLSPQGETLHDEIWRRFLRGK